MRLFNIAVQFLTKIPVKVKGDTAPHELAESLVFFPAVGLLIGLILLISEYFLSFFLPGAIVLLIILIILFLITGGLHLDGLSDTADALGSGKSGDNGLAVMKMGNTGPVGTVSVFFCLALKYLALTEYPTNNLYCMILLFPVMGRMALVAGCSLFNYKSSGNGIGKIFFENRIKNTFIVSGLYTMLLAFIFFQIRGIFIFGFVIGAVIILGKYFTKKFSGLSGDMLGFINETAECIALIGGIVII